MRPIPANSYSEKMINALETISKYPYFSTGADLGYLVGLLAEKLPHLIRRIKDFTYVAEFQNR